MNLADQTILLTVSGSRSKGLETPQSDTDLLGVYIPSYLELLGFNPCKEVIKDRDVLTSLIPSQYVDLALPEVEGVIYSIHKLFRMMTKGSTNLLPLLFGDGSFILRSSPQGAMLRKVASEVLNLQMASALRGCAQGSLSRAEKAPERAPKLVASALYHLMMADQMGRGKSPVIPEAKNVEVLRGIRSGQVNLDEASKLCDHYFDMTKAIDLKESADVSLLNDTCIEIIHTFYQEV